MKIHAYRIVKAKFASSAFSGEGARLFGGRWNSPGTSMIYAAGSTSLAMLEMLVHLQVQDILSYYVVFELTFDQKHVTTPSLPADWRTYPAPPETQNMGDHWTAENSSPVLRVPSVIVPDESNYLLNPGHSAFSQIKISPAQPIQFDPRLIKR